jgi:hypothetical protein
MAIILGVFLIVFIGLMIYLNHNEKFSACSIPVAALPALFMALFAFVITASIGPDQTVMVGSNSYELVEISTDKYVSMDVNKGAVNFGYEEVDGSVHYKQIENAEVHIKYVTSTKPRVEITEYKYDIWRGYIWTADALIVPHKKVYKIYIPDDSYLTTKVKVG